MKFNQRRQFAQVALFSLMALGTGTAFAQASPATPGLTSPSSQEGIKGNATGLSRAEYAPSKILQEWEIHRKDFLHAGDAKKMGIPGSQPVTEAFVGRQVKQPQF